MKLIISSILSLLLLSNISESVDHSRKLKKGKKSGTKVAIPGKNETVPDPCVPLHYRQLTSKFEQQMPPAPGGYLVVKTTFEDLIERDDFPKATEAMISFTMIELSEPVAAAGGLPAFVNLTATYMLSFDDGSSLAMLGTENTSVFTGESTQIWAVVGGTQKMMGATGEGTAICAPTNPTDPTSTVCTFEGQVCL